MLLQAGFGELVEEVGGLHKFVGVAVKAWWPSHPGVPSSEYHMLRHWPSVVGIFGGDPTTGAGP